jgi:hypothetical protein
MVSHRWPSLDVTVMSLLNGTLIAKDISLTFASSALAAPAKALTVSVTAARAVLANDLSIVSSIGFAEWRHAP